jgi:S-adenosyl methyltransferase
MTLICEASSWLPVLTLTNAAARLTWPILPRGLALQRAYYPTTYDAIVLTHARALLTSSPEGATAYIHADLRDPDQILSDPWLRSTLDLSQPVALTLFGVLHFIPDEDGPWGIVARLFGALPSGSYLALQHPTRDFYPEGVGNDRAYRSAGIAFQYRTKDAFARFIAGLEVVPPGIQLMSQWRAEDEPQPRPSAQEAGAYGAIARKP